MWTMRQTKASLSAKVIDPGTVAFMLHRIPEECGLKLRQLSMEIGAGANTLGAAKERGSVPRKLDKLISLLSLKSELLRRGITRGSSHAEIDKLISKVGINEAWLARQLGVTKQALNQYLRTGQGISEDYFEKLSKVLRESGRNTLRVAHDLEKKAA